MLRHAVLYCEFWNFPYSCPPPPPSEKWIHAPGFHIFIFIISNVFRFVLYRVSQKSWHFWIVCQIKDVKYFWEIFICMDGWRSHLSFIWHQNKQIMPWWALATFVKGMEIRWCKNWLSILAEREVPQRRNCRWCDEFMINYDGYGFVPCMTCPTSCPHPLQPPYPTTCTDTSPRTPSNTTTITKSNTTPGNANNTSTIQLWLKM